MFFILFLLSASALASHHRSQVASAWYAGWHASEGFPLSKVPWHKYTHLTYSFAITEPDGTLSITEDDEKQLPRFVKKAHRHGVKALVSVGGWTGSMYFSSDLATPENRTAFVKEVTRFADHYSLDGIDFDWEYPGSQGIGCNIVKPVDTANFLAFLQELRNTTLGSRLILTAATGISPFADENGDPSTDVSGFSKVLDFIAIMNYDVWGPWASTVGPNAPLNDTCASEDNQSGSAVSAVTAWSSAGMPKSQIVLGVPAYGHTFRVAKKDAFPKSNKTLALYAAFNATDVPLGDAWDDAGGEVDQCGNTTTTGGNIDFWGMVDLGYLTKRGDPMPGISHAYDSCSQTPFVYNSTSQIMVSYDDAKSFAAKGRFIKDMGLRGFSMWEAGGDFNNILLDAITGGCL